MDQPLIPPRDETEKFKTFVSLSKDYVGFIRWNLFILIRYGSDISLNMLNQIQKVQ